MVASLYRRVPGTARPTRQQAQGAWAAVSTLRHDTDYPLVVGAYMAAEWTLELTDVRPLSRGALTMAEVTRVAVKDDPSLVHVADRDTVLEELQLATAILERQRAGDDSTPLGVFMWLAWWLDFRDLPGQFVPASAEFEHLRAG